MVIARLGHVKRGRESAFSLGLGGDWGFPCGPVIKNTPADVGNASLIPGSGRSPGGGHGNPLQCSCL